jgi:hypothetical protein
LVQRVAKAPTVSKTQDLPVTPLGPVTSTLRFGLGKILSKTIPTPSGTLEVLISILAFLSLVLFLNSLSTNGRTRTAIPIATFTIVLINVPDGSVPMVGLFVTYLYKLASCPANPIGSSEINLPDSAL